MVTPLHGLEGYDVYEERYEDREPEPRRATLADMPKRLISRINHQRASSRNGRSQYKANKPSRSPQPPAYVLAEVLQELRQEAIHDLAQTAIDGATASDEPITWRAE